VYHQIVGSAVYHQIAGLAVYHQIACSNAYHQIASSGTYQAAIQVFRKIDSSYLRSLVKFLIPDSNDKELAELSRSGQSAAVVTPTLMVTV
jgi:hypothetical protein